MHIGILTTWNQACGIAEHSRALTNALMSAGHQVTIFGNIPYENLVQEEDSRFNVKTCFEVEMRTNKKYCDYNLISGIVNSFCDVFVVQYENLYNGHLDVLFPMINKPIIVEFHSSCIGPLPWGKISGSIIHNNELKLPGRSLYLPMGIPDVKYKEPAMSGTIVSYGLGRNDDNMINQAIKRLKPDGFDLHFTTSYGHQSWKPIEDLLKFIQSSDVVTLLYPPVGAVVSSSAVNLAFACKRPVITTKTNWFSSVVKDTIQVENVDQLSDQLRRLYSDKEYYSEWANRDSVIGERSWTKLVSEHLNLYQSLKR